MRFPYKEDQQGLIPWPGTMTVKCVLVVKPEHHTGLRSRRRGFESHRGHHNGPQALIVKHQVLTLGITGQYRGGPPIIGRFMASIRFMQRIERLEYDGWNVISFRDMQEGDVVRTELEPRSMFVVQVPPLQISYRYTDEFFTFYGQPIMFPTLP